MASCTLIPTSPHLSGGLVSLGKPKPVLWVFLGGSSKSKKEQSTEGALCQAEYCRPRSCWHDGFLHPWVQFPRGFQGCSHLTDAILGTAAGSPLAKRCREPGASMRGGRICPSTATQLQHLQAKPCGKKASAGMWVSTGTPWGPSTQVHLTVGWATEPPRCRGLRCAGGSGKGLTAAVSPPPRHLGSVGPHGGFPSPGDPHGGVLLSLHIWDAPPCPVCGGGFIAWFGWLGAWRATKSINVCHLPGLRFKDDARC